MTSRAFAAILLRVAGFFFLLLAIPMVVGLFQVEAGTHEAETFYSTLENDPSDSENKGDDDHADGEDLAFDVAYASEITPSLQSYILLDLTIGLLLIVFSNPMSRWFVRKLPGEPNRFLDGPDRG